MAQPHRGHTGKYSAPVPYRRIADTGIGISKEDLPNVKAKFFKANSTRRGSGIGLAVADEIINLHGGKLTLDSVEGKGTTVTIQIPLSVNGE